MYGIINWVIEMKKIIAVAMTVLLCVFLSGCSPLYEIIDLFYGNGAVEKAESVPHIAFSNGKLFEDSKEEFFAATEFDEVTSQYAQFRSNIYFNTLSPEEQYIYTALEYAMENNYSNILIDSALSDSVETLIKCLEYLALDSPLLEQNLRYEVGDFTTSYPVDVLGLYEDYAKFNGYYITVKNFDSEMWDKKLQAIEKAKDAVEALPAGLSDFERAEELYLLLAENTEYYNYDDRKDENDVFPYLYDALITGKTHCDGHANALSLLLRLAGIEANEKMYTTENEEEVGHTWVTFCIDGFWYNADSTSDDMIPQKECSMKSGFYFAFSDDMRIYNEDYDEVTPICEESRYMKPDSVVYDLSSDDFSNAVVYAYDQREPDWALIVVHGKNTTLLEKQLQKCADKTYSTVYWITNDLANGSTAVIVYEKGVL